METTRALRCSFGGSDTGRSEKGRQREWPILCTTSSNAYWASGKTNKLKMDLEDENIKRPMSAGERHEDHLKILRIN
jgi:hypothetical protein